MKTQIEKETVELAISELRSHNKPVNLQSVMDLTGNTRHHLITQGYAYLVRKAKHSINAGPVNIVRPGAVVEPIDLEHSVEAYTAHIRDNYFIHAETIKDVELTMLAEVSGFQCDVYRRAINLLMLSNELRPHTVKTDHFIGNFALVEPEPTPPVAEPQEQPVQEEPTRQRTRGKANKVAPGSVYLATQGQTVIYSGSDIEQATKAAAQQAFVSDDEVQIYQIIKTVRAEVIITEQNFE